MLSFFVAALLRPDTQKLAQEELDTVTGRERLPTFEDRPKLPFVNAICTELIRWRPVAPLGEFLLSTHRRRNLTTTGVPGTTTRDDVYEGFFIPKGLYSQRACLSPSRLLICHLRRGGDNEHMVRYLH